MPLGVWLSLVHNVHMATTIETSGEKHSYLFFVPISHIPLDQQISVSFPFGIPPTKISGKAGIFEPAWFLPRNLQAKLIGMMQVWATEFRCLKRFSHLCEKDSSKFGLIFSQQTGVNVAHVWTEKKIYNIYIYIYRPWTMKALQDWLSLCDGFTVRKKLPDAQQELIEVSWSNQGVLLSHLGRIL